MGFVGYGKTFDACTNHGPNGPKYDYKRCATTSSYDEDKKWGKCPEEDEGDDGSDGEDLGFVLISEESRGICTSCPHLGGGAVTGGVEGCKKLCRDTANCNAFNYKNNVCYTKKCAADCDIKPITSQGGWNVWLANELNCEPIEDDPCKPNPCQNGGTCPDGFEGDNCETEAKKNPLEVGGIFADRVIDWNGPATNTGWWLPAAYWTQGGEGKSLCPLLAEGHADHVTKCRAACEKMPECNVINYCAPPGSSHVQPQRSPCLKYPGMPNKCELRQCTKDGDFMLSKPTFYKQAGANNDKYYIESMDVEWDLYSYSNVKPLPKQFDWQK